MRQIESKPLLQNWILFADGVQKVRDFNVALSQVFGKNISKEVVKENRCFHLLQHEWKLKLSITQTKKTLIPLSRTDIIVTPYNLRMFPCDYLLYGLNKQWEPINFLFTLRQ